MNLIPISTLDTPEVSLYAQSRESQLAHYFEPAPGLFLAESCHVIERALDAGCQPLSFLVETEKLKDPFTRRLLERCEGTPVYAAKPALLREIIGYHLTGGILSAMYRKELPSAAALCNTSRRIAVMEAVTNPTNVGAIFRSAAALGMDAVLLHKGCSDPLYRRAIRVSMGNVFQVPWTALSATDSEQLFPLLKYHGYQTIAMALTENAVRLQDLSVEPDEKLAVFLGNEGYGLSPQTIQACDTVVMIPMKHHVDSLNVAAASAVVFWELAV